jgi:hypothetical protein
VESNLDLNRRSDRISLHLPVLVSGADVNGQSFRDDTHTLLVTRHGGKILLGRDLDLESEVMIHYARRGREAAVRILNRLSSMPGVYQYGIEFLDRHENLWGIHFPSASEAADAVGRVLLECIQCHAQEVACLDGLSLELFHANRTISRPCKCSEAKTTWGEVFIELPGESIPGVRPPQPAAAERTLAERRAEGWNIQACVNSEVLGEDMVWTRSPSKDGVRFLSERQYLEKEKVEIAMPYQPGGGNVFIPAEIRFSSSEPEGGLYLYDAAYLRRVRKSARYAATVKVYMGILGVGLRLTGRIVDLSMTGVLMRTSEILEPGLNVRLGIEMGVDTFRTVAVVRRMVPGVGVAFEFLQMSQRDRQLLGRLLASMKIART